MVFDNRFTGPSHSVARQALTHKTMKTNSINHTNLFLITRSIKKTIISDAVNRPQGKYQHSHAENSMNLSRQQHRYSMSAAKSTGARGGIRTHNHQDLDLARLPVAPPGQDTDGAQGGIRTHNSRLLRPERLPIASPGRKQKTPFEIEEGFAARRQVAQRIRRNPPVPSGAGLVDAVDGCE